MDSTQRKAPFGRLPERQLSFSTRIAKLDDVPFTFRKTVTRLLAGREQQVRHILSTPEFGSFGEYCPATLFIVTDEEWLAMSAKRSGAPSVRYADFAETRFVEFSLTLLDGRLVLESGEVGEAACVLRFNLASRDLFQVALSAMLGKGANGATDGPAELPGFSALSMSMSMRSTLSEAVMPGDKCLALAAWSRADVASASDRLALQPGGLLLTERYLCVVSADDPSESSSSGDLSVYHRGVVYLSRRWPIVGHRISHGDDIDELTLAVGEGTQVSTLSLFLPQASKPEVDQVLDRVITGH